MQASQNIIEALVNAWMLVAHNSKPHSVVCQSFDHIDFPETTPAIENVRRVLKFESSEAELRLAVAFMLLQRDVLKQPYGLSPFHSAMLAMDTRMNKLICKSRL